MTECFSTFITFIWPLPTVDSLVHNKTCPLTKGLPTLITLIGFLPSVDSLVPDQACVLTEGLTTFLALHFVVDILMGKEG